MDNENRAYYINIAALSISILSLIIAGGGVWCAMQQLEMALYQIEYPNLNVTHQIDEENGILKITLENTASKKETGTINFYRLEVSDSKPHLQKPSLKPGENMTLNLAIEIDEKNYTIYSEKVEYPLLASFKIPESTVHKLYFITEDTSISYKITCDNCYPQGIVRRIPDWGTIESGFSIGPNKTISGLVPIYSWTTYTPEDLP